ncbi:hypothetical protein D1AOALGA4SA_11803 [Olavius algarvensis Delta 1 endosymbiont]|nr:hypothetical protein D1AOALGA4SA_11803 [Olavius algarvensis Delta 1 endosymbiont]
MIFEFWNADFGFKVFYLCLKLIDEPVSPSRLRRPKAIPSIRNLKPKLFSMWIN